MDDTELKKNDDEWVPVGHYPSLSEAHDHGLVVLAMGEGYRLEPGATPGEFDLQTEAAPALKIVAELDAYSEESRQSLKPDAASDWSRHPAGWHWCVIWALTLMVVFSLQGRDPDLVEKGASSSIGIFENGEWWRPFTALFLHADVPHLAGNLLGGTIFAALVSKIIGPWRAWPLILLSGAVGNFTTAWLRYPEPFLSIGASTAVFAALGILSGTGLVETLQTHGRSQWARTTAPLLAGMVLLGWLGSGGDNPNTDVLGHMLGFSAGVVAGGAVGAVIPHSTPR